MHIFPIKIRGRCVKVRRDMNRKIKKMKKAVEISISLIIVMSLVLGIFYTANILASPCEGTATINSEEDPQPLAGPAAVDLGTAGDFVVLSKTGISSVVGTPTLITGDIGVSPIADTAITGFALVRDSTNTFSTSVKVIGRVYAANMASPTPAKMTTAVSNMETAYNNAAGTAPDVTELGDGDIGGLDLVPGCYKWSTGLIIPTNLTLSGGADDVWIFEIAQTLSISSATSIILNGSINPDNIFWQVAQQVTLGTTSVFYGNILCKTAIVIQTDATLNGRALAQTAVTLDGNTVTVPPVAGNLPPVFGTPSPVNNSINQTKEFVWGIPINDTEGDLINYNISCSNGNFTNVTIATNGTKTLSISGLTQSTNYTIWVNATDPAGSGDWTRAWYQFNTTDNFSPVLGAPSPTNESIDQSLTLTWQIPISDPDGDLIDYNLSCSNGDFTNITGVSNSTKSLSLAGLSYSTTYTVWVNATDAGSGGWTRAWYTFTTGITPEGRPVVRHYAPTADPNGPYTGIINIPIQFDGSGSHVNFGEDAGTLIEYDWGFYDGDTLHNLGPTPTHTYTIAGTYTVTLRVLDSKDGIGIGKTTVTIKTTNTPPITPTITGPTTGNINTDYSYTITATDPDNNNIRYVIDWNDGTTKTTSTFSASGTRYATTHKWKTNGVFTIKVNAEDDNGGISGTTTIQVTIGNAINPPVNGYLVDTNGDGILDSFHNNATGANTKAQKQTDGTYLIDTNGDSIWDYVYDPALKTYTPYNGASKGTNWLLWAGIIAVISVAAGGLVMLMRRRKTLG
jgi:hypothetical protein